MSGEIDIEVEEAKPLSTMPWFAGTYAKIYEILSVDGRLPQPSGILIATKIRSEPPKTLLGLTMRERHTIWFKELPPPPWLFAHELIHLARKEDDTVPEETYASVLSDFVVYLAERGIVPRNHPLTLLEDVTLSDVLNAINEVFGGGFNTLEDFLQTIGIMLYPNWVFYAVGEKNKVIQVLIELMDGAMYGNPLMLRVLLKLLGSN